MFNALEFPTIFRRWKIFFSVSFEKYLGYTFFFSSNFKSNLKRKEINGNVFGNSALWSFCLSQIFVDVLRCVIDSVRVALYKE